MIQALKNHRLIWLLAGVLIIGSSRECMAAGALPSTWVYPSPNTHNLLYGTDTNGVCINDFSESGYKRGLRALPNVTNLIDISRWLFLHPLGGGADDGAGINAALNFLGSQPPLANGFRGVVCLGPGIYYISDTNSIRITNSGLILKGSGSTTNNGTMLLAASSHHYSLIQLEGPGDRVLEPPVLNQFVERLVPAGTRTFRIDDTNNLHVGDSVVVTHPTTEDWLRAISADALRTPWVPGNYEGYYERIITRIEDNWVTVDTPLPQTFDANYCTGRVEPFTGTNRLQNCAVEDLYCYSNYGNEDESNPNSCVRVLKTTDSWIRRVTAQGFFSSAVSVGQYSKFITVAECQNLTHVFSDVHFRYSFYLEKGAQPQYVLMRDCYSYRSRHSFVTGTMVPGPFAFVRCDASYSDDETGPHERWATGGLWDNVRELGGQLISLSGHEIGVENRGNSGRGTSSHGWTGAYMAVWNSYAEDGFRVRNPPTARNWLIGSDGEKKASRHGCSIFVNDEGNCWAIGPDPSGTYDQSGEGSQAVQLKSLYYAQLQQRLKWPGSQFREYRLGDIDHFGSVDPADIVPLDTNWLAQVHFLTTTGVIEHVFDAWGPNLWTAFTFNCPIGAGEQVVAASMTLGLHRQGGTALSDHHLYLETIDIPHSFTALGWDVATNGTSTHTLELSPADLQDGHVNVALDPNCAVDFAVLNFQVAPILSTYTNVLTPLDTYVQDGAYANQNYSNDPNLIVKKDNDANFSRRAFMQWNLGEANGPLIDAKIRLHCTSAGQAGNEQSVALVQGSWSPFVLTWNNQPATLPPFAYWIPDGPGFVSEFSVTPEVLEVLGSSDHYLSLCIDSAGDYGPGGIVGYGSSKNPDYSIRPELVLRYSNAAPLLIVPGNRTMNANSTLGPLAVTVGDAETWAGGLVLTAASSVTSVIANSDITLGGSLSNRTITIHVPAGRVGTSTIMLSLSDGSQVVSNSFVVNVNYVNAAPTISTVTNQITDEDKPLAVSFTIADANNVPNNLGLQVTSSNNQLFPTGSIQVLPHNATGNRTAVFAPAPNLSGITTAMIRVDDGFLSTTQAFTLTVRAVADAPQYVRLTQPHAGDNLLPGVPALLSAQAFDAETNLARVQFYCQTVNARIPLLLGVSSNAPYAITWSNPPAGNCTLYAIAYDQTSLTATSPPVAVTVSVPTVYPDRIYIASSNDTIAVFWPTSLSSNAVQSTTNLTPPIQWSPLTSPPLEGDGAWVHYLQATEPRRFFRLTP